jgi:thymidylate synthase (FAD)
MTEWIWTGSLAAFVRVCKLRLDAHAQQETREIAQLIAENLQRLFPVSWEALKGN